MKLLLIQKFIIVVSRNDMLRVQTKRAYKIYVLTNNAVLGALVAGTT